MVKPIGNLVANRPPGDKVSAKTRARYGPKSLTPPGAAEVAAAKPPAARPVKFKTRKR